MTWAEYLALWRADLTVYAIWWTLGFVSCLVLVFKVPHSITKRWIRPSSSLVLPEEHPLTQKPTLQEIQTLSGK